MFRESVGVWIVAFGVPNLDIQWLLEMLLRCAL